jgi:glycosyltransferase involved in cell wall biosynthesis
MIKNYQDIFYQLPVAELVLLAVFGVLFLLRLLYLFLFTGRILFRKKRKNDNADRHPFSLLVIVRNEEDKLKNNLPKILSVNNIDFEMVVVDDFSQDNSYLVLGLLRDRYKRLTISTLNQETRFSVKLAQNIGIKATQNEWVVNIPVSTTQPTPEWLAGISETITENKNVIVGYSTIIAEKGYYNRLFRIENFHSFLKSTGYILNGIPLVFSDENVAFKKEKYFEIGGYRQKMNEPYANLELLFNLFIRKKTTTVLFSKTNAIKKAEQIKRSDFFELLKKSIRIKKHLSVQKKLFLLLDEMGKLLFLPLAIFVIILFPDLWILVSALIGFKLLAHLVIIKITQNRLNEHKIFISSLVYELIMPYYKLFFRWHFNRQSKKNRWRSKV